MDGCPEREFMHSQLWSLEAQTQDAGRAGSSLLGSWKIISVLCLLTPVFPPHLSLGPKFSFPEGQIALGHTPVTSFYLDYVHKDSSPNQVTL